MRQQEDKIYAMEDYLAQYQQLLCEARQENARLRRELAERKTSPTPTPADTTGPKPWSPDRDGGPAINPPGVPSSPPATTPAGPPDIEPAEPLDDASGEPDVPPLDATSLRDVDLPSGEDQLRREPEVLMVWAEDPAPGPPRHVWLNGQVFPGDDRSGARLLVDVEPLADGGGPATFAGELSLMLLDPAAEPGSRSVARWDFSAAQIEETAERVANGRAMRFRLQLPPDAAVSGPVELWVRLVDDKAGKLLAHADVELGKRDQFSSIRPAPAANPLVADSPDRAVAETRVAAGRPGWSQWQVARPGESNLLSERTGRAEGSWQAAATPPPAALGRPVPEVVPASLDREAPAPASSDDRYATEQPVVAPPSWSPTR